MGWRSVVTGSTLSCCVVSGCQETASAAVAAASEREAATLGTDAEPDHGAGMGVGSAVAAAAAVGSEEAKSGDDVCFTWRGGSFKVRGRRLCSPCQLRRWWWCLVGWWWLFSLLLCVSLSFSCFSVLFGVFLAGWFTVSFVRRWGCDQVSKTGCALHSVVFTLGAETIEPLAPGQTDSFGAPFGSTPASADALTSEWQTSATSTPSGAFKHGDPPPAPVVSIRTHTHALLVYCAIYSLFFFFLSFPVPGV